MRREIGGTGIDNSLEGFAKGRQRVKATVFQGKRGNSMFYSKKNNAAKSGGVDERGDCRENSRVTPLEIW